jgi:quinol monooxygenase YgiN
MALHLFARFHARPGCAHALEAAIHAVGEATRLERGCLGWQAFRSVRVGDEFHIHSLWADRAAFELHVSLPHTEHFVAAVEPLIDHPLAVALAEPMECSAGRLPLDQHEMPAPACTATHKDFGAQVRFGASPHRNTP